MMRVETYIRSCPPRASVLQVAAASLNASDLPSWSPVIQPTEIPMLSKAWTCYEPAAQWWGHQVERIAQSEADLLILLEDDITVNAHIHHNVVTHPCWKEEKAGCLWLSTPNGVLEDHEKLTYVGGLPVRNHEALHFAGGIAITPAMLRLCLATPDVVHPQVFDIFISNACWKNGLHVFLASPALVRHQDVPSTQGHDPKGAMSDQYFSGNFRRF